MNSLNKSKVAISFLLGLVFLSSCANLRQVNEFSSLSLKSVESFETLGYNFHQNCISLCREKDVTALRLNPDSCNCAIEQKADSVNFIIYQAIRDYLAGLTRLSKENLTSYNYDAVVTSLNGDELAGLHLTTDQATAYSKIAGIVTDVVTDDYRKTKIRLYIRNANQPLHTLIHYLQFNISGNLVKTIQATKIRIKSDYFNFLRNSEVTPFEKRKAIEDYYKANTELDNYIAVLLNYGKLLQVIADGHQQLYINEQRLSKNDVKTAVRQYVSDLEDIYTQIQLIKNDI